MTSRLATLSGLRVIARSSASREGDDEGGIAGIARRLDVRWVVEGSARFDGNAAEVVAKLTDAGTGEAAWSGTFTPGDAEFFNDVAGAAERIAAAMDVAITPAERERLRTGGTINGDALRHYLQGRDAVMRGTGAAMLTGAGHFENAIAADPAFAAAYAGLAACHASIGEQARDRIARDSAAARSTRAALASIGLDPSLAEAHSTLAAVRFRLEWNFREAEAGFRRALDLAPGLANARREYGELLSLLGRQDEALAELRPAAELDPLSSGVKAAIGNALYYKREYDASIEAFRRALDADPSDADAHLGMGRSCAAALRYHEAVEAVNEAIRLTGEGGAALAALGYVYAKRGDRASAIAILDRFRRPEDGSSPAPFFAAAVLHGLGSDGDAMSFLEQAYEERDGRLLGLGVDPAWDGARGDPRFSALLMKIGLGK